MSAQEVLVTGADRAHVASTSLGRAGPWRQVPHLARLDAPPLAVCFESGEMLRREPGKCPVHIWGLGQCGSFGRVECAHHVTCSANCSWTKHQRQSSPGSNDCMIGCFVS